MFSVRFDDITRKVSLSVINVSILTFSPEPGARRADAEDAVAKCDTITFKKLYSILTLYCTICIPSLVRDEIQNTAYE